MYKRTDRKRWLLAAVMLLAVALMLSGCIQIRVFGSAYETEQKFTQPLLYEKDGEVFMASGSKTLSLGMTDIYDISGSLNAAFTGDNRFLFYIEYGAEKTSGTLKKVESDASSEPVAVAEGVCAAQVSGDGSKVLYITGIEDITGDLYLKTGDAQAELITQNVLPRYYGFSGKGSSIYYFTQGGVDSIALNLKYKDSAPAIIAKYTAEPYINYGVCVDNVGDTLPDDEGQMLYSFYNDEEIAPLTLYNQNGNTETFCEDGSVVKIFGSADDLLYSKWEKDETESWVCSLWYKSPGQDGVKIAESGYMLFWGGQDMMYGTDLTGGENDKHFIFTEPTGDYYTESGAMLYEQQLGSEKIEIAETSGYYVHVSPIKNCVAYERGGKSYMSRKVNGSWVEDKVLDSQEFSYNGTFDASGKYFYYIDTEGQNYTGTLCRYSVKTGKEEEIYDGASLLYIFGDTAYTVRENGDAYRIDGGNAVQIGESIGTVLEAAGGVFLETSDFSVDYNNTDTDYDYSGTDSFDIYYVESDSSEAQLLCSGAKMVYISSIIDFTPPMDRDPGRALDVLMGEANYFEVQLGGEDYGYEQQYTIEEDTALAQKMCDLVGQDDWMFGMFSNLYEGFKNYGLWKNEAPGAKKDEYFEAARQSLLSATDEYADQVEGD